MNIDTFTNKYQMCTSCGLCQSVFGMEKIELEEHRGFYFPKEKKPLNKSDKQLFNNICPAVNMKGKISQDKKFDSVIGSYVAYYNGYSSDKHIRWKSSTGGGITSFSNFLLQEGYVDGILHIGEGKTVFKAEASISKTMDEILNKSGSQYMPTSLLINIIDYLEEDKLIAVIGKPCDIRAVNNLLEQFPKYKKKIFITISFLCGGIPSIDSTYSLVEKFGLQKSNVNKLKYRGEGWPGDFSILSKDGTLKSMNYDEAWGENLGRTVPLVCKVCVDSVGEYADVVFGDAWENDEKGYPVFTSRDGNNLIITRSNKGENLIKLANEKGYLILKSEKTSQFRTIQPSQTIRRTTSKQRVLALKFTKLGSITFDKDHIQAISKNKYSFLKKIKFTLGTFRRVSKAKKNF